MAQPTPSLGTRGDGPQVNPNMQETQGQVVDPVVELSTRVNVLNPDSLGLMVDLQATLYFILCLTRF